MSSSAQAFLTALAAGLVLLVVAALLDRRARLRAERVEIPDVVPARPEEVAAGAPAGRPIVRRAAQPFTDAERATVDAWRQGAGVVRFAAGLASEKLASHLDPATAIVTDADVLVVAERVGSMRELLPTCERVLAAHRSLLLVTGAVPDEVVDTLAVNRTAGILASAVVLADDVTCARFAAATGATQVTRQDLMSGFIPRSAYGHVLRAVCDAASTCLDTDLNSPGVTGAPDAATRAAD